MIPPECRDSGEVKATMDTSGNRSTIAFFLCQLLRFSSSYSTLLCMIIVDLLLLRQWVFSSNSSRFNVRSQQVQKFYSFKCLWVVFCSITMLFSGSQLGLLKVLRINFEHPFGIFELWCGLGQDLGRVTMLFFSPLLTMSGGLYIEPLGTRFFICELAKIQDFPLELKSHLDLVWSLN